MATISSCFLAIMRRRTRTHNARSVLNLQLINPESYLTPFLSKRNLNVICKDRQDNSSTQADDGKKKKKQALKITLIGKNNSISITSLEEAQKLSKRRDLKLIKVQDFDRKTERPVYRLVSTSELLAEEVEESSNEKSVSKKSEKNLNIGGRISEHDLSLRIKNVLKWLKKGHYVRVLIEGNANDSKACENIFAVLQNSIKPENGQISQKSVKSNNIKFIIQPNKQNIS